MATKTKLVHLPMHVLTILKQGTFVYEYAWKKYQGNFSLHALQPSYVCPGQTLCTCHLIFVAIMNLDVPSLPILLYWCIQEFNVLVQYMYSVTKILHFCYEIISLWLNIFAVNCKRCNNMTKALFWYTAIQITHNAICIAIDTSHIVSIKTWKQKWCFLLHTKRNTVTLNIPSVTLSIFECLKISWNRKFTKQMNFCCWLEYITCILTGLKNMAIKMW